MAISREDQAISALLFAYCNSCRRSEGRTKWTCNDQRAHEKLRNALLLYMDEDLLDQSVMQITYTQNLPASPATTPTDTNSAR